MKLPRLILRFSQGTYSLVHNSADGEEDLKKDEGRMIIKLCVAGETEMI